MLSYLPLLAILLIACVAYFGSRARALASVSGDARALPSLPRQYALNGVFSVVIPAAAILAVGGIAGLGQGAFRAAVVVGALGAAGAMIWSTAGMRARIATERWIMAVLIAASGIAILTTVGIVLSMLFETRNFFGQYDWRDFFFSAEWSPNFRGDSALGILPLLWGTLYISAIALAFAVPIGLFAAIYLSEYAGPRMRGVAKPVIEILAGIPTIVYGLFALITVGPFLRDYFAQPMGWGDSASSVMTAGLVMGIMLIPFVSSLSDDIINAVPQSLRDGSLGLGATKSETIRQVVVPAALPGIVGAVLLAASRAIGVSSRTWWPQAPVTRPAKTAAQR